MKRTILIFLIAVLFTTSSKAIDFYKGNYQQALQKAKTENKRIFLYFTAIWCGPCRYMDQYVYPDAALTTYVNQHYVALKVDIDTKEGKLLYIKSHQPKGPMGVPAMILMNTKEEIIKKQTGGMKLSQLQEFLLVEGNETVIYRLLADSLAKKQLPDSTKKPTFWKKFYFNAMVSNWKPAIKIGTNVMGFSSNAPSKGNVMGYEIGFFMDRSFKIKKPEKIGFWHSSRYIFQPGLSFTSKAGNLTINGVENRFNIHYLELGLVNSYQFKGLGYYRLFVSPYAATGLWATQKIADQRQPLNLGEDFSRIDYGLKFGLSRNMGSFDPFIGYNLGLKDIRSGTELVKHRGFYLSFALIVGK